MRNSIIPFIIISILLSGCDNEDYDYSKDVKEVSISVCSQFESCHQEGYFQDTFTTYDECIEMTEDALNARLQLMEDWDALHCWDYQMNLNRCSLDLQCEDMEDNWMQLCEEEFQTASDCMDDAISLK